MRKNPSFPDKSCLTCSCSFSPSSPSQLFCQNCGKKRDADRKRNFYIKNNPGAYAVKPESVCCVCGAPFSSSFDGLPYCNKHYLRMKLNGTTDLTGRHHGNPYTVSGNVAFLTTSSGISFLADSKDLPLVLRYTWCLSKTGYLVANVNYKVTKLHCYLLNPDQSSTVDHVDGNPLNNCRNNLRICTPSENAKNNISKKSSRSGHQGIRITKSNRFVARITVNRVDVHIGTFDTIEEAISARKSAENVYYGEFSPSNSRIST